MTQEELQKRIKVLKDAGIDASAEEAQLAALTAGPVAAAPILANPSSNEDFVPLNTESYKAGWSGGWISPATTGVKDAICEGYIMPERLEGQIWFVFNSLLNAPEAFRGSLVCGALTAETGKSAAGKIKDVAVALGINNQVEVVEGQGIRGLNACKGKLCKVLWEDVSIKRGNDYKTERRIQDIIAPDAEPVM